MFEHWQKLKQTLQGTGFEAQVFGGNVLRPLLWGRNNNTLAVCQQHWNTMVLFDSISLSYGQEGENPESKVNCWWSHNNLRNQGLKTGHLIPSCRLFSKAVKTRPVHISPIQYSILHWEKCYTYIYIYILCQDSSINHISVEDMKWGWCEWGILVLFVNKFK